MRLSRLTPLLPPLLLALVAVAQLWFAQARDLSPWKGGGFGMFATVDSPAARFLRIYLVRDGEAIPVLLPGPFTGEGRRCRTLPSRACAEDLARKLSAGRWVPLELSTAADHYRSLSRSKPATAATTDVADRAAVHTGLAIAGDLAPQPQVHLVGLWRMQEDGEPDSPDELHFDAVRVEVWRTSLRSGALELVAQRVMRASVGRD